MYPENRGAEKPASTVVNDNSKKLGIAASLLLIGGAWLACRDGSATEVQLDAGTDVNKDQVLEQHTLPPIEDLRVEVEPPPQPTETVITLHDLYEVKVNVKDKNGKPVCRAEVKLILNNPDSNSDDAYQLEQPLPVTKLDGVSTKIFKQERLIKGVTERTEAGSKLVVTPSAPLPPGHSRVLLTVNCTGYSKVKIETDLDLTKQNHEFDVVLDRGFAVLGTVRYSDGRPVVNATIVCSLHNGSTNELGEIVGNQMGCDGKTFKSPGIFGFQSGERYGMRIWSKEPGYEEFNSNGEFQFSDINLDVILHPTPKISLTVRDCLTGELLFSDKPSLPNRKKSEKPQFGINEWIIDPNATQHNLNSHSSRTSFDDTIENELVYLRYKESTHFAFGFPGAIGPVQELPKFTDVQLDSAPIPFEMCVVRTKPVSLQATVMTKNPDGSFTESAVSRFRISYRVNGSSPASWGSSTDIPAGPPFDVSSILMPFPTRPGTSNPIETVELCRVECIAPDLRQGTLTDLDNNILAPQTDNLGSSGVLFTPISLIADPTPAKESVPVEYLKFRIYPPGS